MRKWAGLLTFFAASWLTAPASGQELFNGIFYSRVRQFTIPYIPDANFQRLKQLQLFVSTDQGRSWQASATAPPPPPGSKKGSFPFITDKDGYYWFTVQTLDVDNKLYPPTLQGAQPSLKVIVDTQNPVVTLHPLPPQGGLVGVRWEVRDENVDLALSDALRLEYRVPGNPNWQPLTLPVGAQQHSWNPQTTGVVEVRLRARDRAGNWGEALTSTSANAAGNAGQFAPAQNDPVTPQAAGASPVGDVERKYVGSKRINLNYELKDVGPSGVSQVELWFTLDGRTWNKYPLRFGEDTAQKNVSFDVAGEGIYGLTLVAKSGVGLGEKPPQIGDRPQVWIEVDTTKPLVRLQNVTVGDGLEKGKVMVSWTAFDKNPQRDPISLYYATAPTGPWTPIVQKLPNTGRYVWNLPPNVPYQFLIKVEALDQALNVGEAITENLIRVDLSQPKVRIVTVEPGAVQ